MSKKEERVCKICGETFISTRWNNTICSDPDCKLKAKQIRTRRWFDENKYHMQELRRQSRERKAGRKPEYHHEPKPDTIVAIGYAERQIAKSLEMAGKVRTEL